MTDDSLITEEELFGDFLGRVFIGDEVKYFLLPRSNRFVITYGQRIIMVG